MSQHTSQRSVEERASSYKRQFGGGRSMIDCQPIGGRSKVSYQSSNRYSRSSGRSVGETRGGHVVKERVTFARGVPGCSGVSNEKAELQHLNDRFAGYITKVRNLEQANMVLEEQLSQLTSTRSSTLAVDYEEELNRLRREIDSLTHERSTLGLKLDSVLIELAKWRDMYDDEQATRKEVEVDLHGMRKDCDDATLVRLDLERRLVTLQEEIEFLKKTRQQEVEELEHRIKISEMKIEAAPAPDLEEALHDMRAQYEEIARMNREAAEHWYQDKVGRVKEKAVQYEESLRSVKDELSEYRKNVQTLNLEIDSMRGTNDFLQRNLGELEDRYSRDMNAHQETINNLQVECEDMKTQMTRHLGQYQDLMDVKMALDVEIATYRKLLEGEETRITEKVQTMGSTGQGYSSASRSYGSHVHQETADCRTAVGGETVTTKKFFVKTRD